MKVEAMLVIWMLPVLAPTEAAPLAFNLSVPALA